MDKVGVFFQFRGRQVTFDGPPTNTISGIAVEEIKTLADSFGIKPRFLPPGSPRSMGASSERVNFEVELASDGSYRIAKIFQG